MDKHELNRLIRWAEGLKFQLKPSERRNQRKAVVEQDAGNCWLYSCFNNLWLQLGYKISQSEIDQLKARLTELGIDVNEGNNEALAGAVIVERWNKKNPDRKIAHFFIEFEKDPQLMGELRKQGYSFIYTRSTKSEIQNDIRDNDVVDAIHQLKGQWHAVNVCLKSKEEIKIMEIGQWGDDHFANYFEYKDAIIFGRNIQSGTIHHAFSFFDFI